MPFRTRLRAVALPFALFFTGAPAFAASSEGVRDAAQKGVVFLAKSTAEWQRTHNCYGCHVQAVTMEGLSVGKANQYQVPAKELQALIDGMLHLPGGARGPGGITHSGFPRTAKIFGGAALARYDALVDGKLTDDLLVTAKAMVAFQNKDGSVPGDHVGPPVTTGPVQATFQAAQTWRQAFARTGDDVWLPPLRKAESWLTTTAKAWKGEGSLHDLNYALLGVLAGGASKSDALVQQLSKQVLARQHKSGGWGFNSEPDPFATGQSVYALRQAGFTETDDRVAKGLAWLIAHQEKDGGWGHSGAAKAEAMWAVLGLVSTDVMSVAMGGIADGQHVGPLHTLTVKAEENSGGQVKKVELVVDDQVVAKADGGTLSHTWKTEGLASGRHTVDAVATNAKGQVSRRRLEVYAGDVFFGQLGTRFGQEGTQVTVRGLEGTTMPGNLVLTVRAAKDDKGSPMPGDVVSTTTLPFAAGPIGFVFGTKDEKGKARAAGRYFAEVAFVDAKGARRQSEQTLFLHDDAEAQAKKFGEVAGNLGFASDGRGASGGLVELVDDDGRVVQKTTSNEAGNYRFKNVDPGKYKVRFSKKGFDMKESDVEAAPAAVAPASVKY